MYTLFNSQSGELSASYTNPENQTFLIHSQVDPRQECELLQISDIWGDIILCLGTGLGYHLTELAASTRPKYIILIDNCSEFLQITSEKLNSSSSKILTIPTFDDNLLQRSLVSLFTEIRGLDLSIQVIQHPAAYRLAKDTIDPVSDKIFHFYKENKPETKRNVTKENGHRVLVPFGGHFLQQEIVNALHEMNIPFKTFQYEGLQDEIEWKSITLKIIQDFRPTLVLTINMKGLDSEGFFLEYANKMGIAVHTWFVDDPRMIAMAYTDVSFPTIHAWTWEKFYIPWLQEKGFSNARWLPLAGDPSLFKPPSKHLNQRFNLVFTGSSMSGEYLDTIRRAFLWDENVEIIAQQRALALQTGQCDITTLLRDIDLPFNDDRNRLWFECLAIHTASHLKRIEFIKPLLTRDILLAGDKSNWQTIFPGYQNIIGDVQYRTQLCNHYQLSKIQVNLTSLQMPSAVNQRVFDVPLSGSFLLTDHQEDLDDFFLPDSFISFATSEELEEKCDWYLTNDSERNRITQRLRSQILTHHTYTNRITTILS